MNGAGAGATFEAAEPDYPVSVKPKEGAPNVVVILLDDMGFAQPGCFGSDIATPNIDHLADGGLRYNRFHVTALCSPTRASLLTGRNHHAVGAGFVVDAPLAYPGYNGRIPRSAASLPKVLRDAGYNTMAVGKWHLTPGGERSPSGPFDRWPLGLGFERFYGFLHADTNQWTPNLVCDNHYIEPPATPAEGYHLSEDLADRAIQMLLDQHHSSPEKPFFLYLAFGAVHSPHHAAAEWVDPYRGQFDGGWERWREEVFDRQVTSGVVPEGTVLTKRPDWVDPWAQLDREAQQMHARGQEVFAGFLTHTDFQIGRVIDALARIGKLDDTVIVLTSDNGASAEGGRLGSINEHRFPARLEETVAGNLALGDAWGGFRAYNHYSWGWAWAGNTPFHLWKRYTWLGGTRTPLIVHWPGGLDAHGEVRNQFCHVVDVMPTILDLCGVETPEVVDGISQQRIDGASIAPTFLDADAPDPRQTQYFEMIGSRSIVHGGWKSTTDHVSQGVPDEEELMTGSRDFASDHWALFSLQDDFSEARDLSAEHPEIVEKLRDLWFVEAGRNQVMPMSDGLLSRLGAFIGREYPVGAMATFYPGGSPVPDEAIPRLTGPFSITADVEVAGDHADGVVFALGDWNGGYALFALEGLLQFSFVPYGERFTLTAGELLAGGRHQVTVSFAPSGASSGSLHLEVDGEEVASTEVNLPMPAAFQHGGSHLCLGHDRGFPVSDAYQPPFPWKGLIHEVRYVTAPADAGGRRDVETALRAD